MDMVGRNRDDKGEQANTVYLVGSDRISTELHNLSEEANASQSPPLTLDYELNDPTDLEQVYYRSDHFEFAKEGVPALYPDDGIDYVGKPAGWGLEQRAKYTREDYHKPSDEVKPDWDLSGMVEDAQMLFLVGYRVANDPKMPEWRPGNEFRAKREESLRKAAVK